MFEYHGELYWAISGEIYGEALFATTAEQTMVSKTRMKCELLAKVEQKTLAALQALQLKYGIIIDEGAYQQKGVANGQKIIERGWADTMSLFLEDVDADIERMQALHDQAPEDDQPILALLVAHEVALKNFIFAETQNDPDSCRFLSDFLA